MLQSEEILKKLRKFWNLSVWVTSLTPVNHRLGWPKFLKLHSNVWEGTKEPRHISNELQFPAFTAIRKGLDKNDIHRKAAMEKPLRNIKAQFRVNSGQKNVFPYTAKWKECNVLVQIPRLTFRRLWSVFIARGGLHNVFKSFTYYGFHPSLFLRHRQVDGINPAEWTSYRYQYKEFFIFSLIL